MGSKTTLIGILAGIGGLALGALMEGTNLVGLFNIPAALIVLGGTFGAVMAGTSMDRIKAIPSLYKKAIGGEKPDLKARLELLVGFGARARRDGLLALDEETSKIDDAYTRKAVQLIVDGTDPELVREVLENEVDGMAARHKAAVGPFEKGGGFAPTMGVLGTVMGLVHVLENLDKPETLGPAIAGAFIATLYGVGAANVIFLPVANKLKEMSSEEVDLRVMTLEGILSLQAGDNPRVIEDKLSAYIPPAERDSADAAESGDAERLAA